MTGDEIHLIPFTASTSGHLCNHRLRQPFLLIFVPIASKISSIQHSIIFFLLDSVFLAFVTFPIRSSARIPLYPAGTLIGCCLFYFDAFFNICTKYCTVNPDDIVYISATAYKTSLLFFPAPTVLWICDRYTQYIEVVASDSLKSEFN